MEKSKFDQLIYITCEAEVSEEDIVDITTKLFPKFNPNLTTYHNDQFLTPYNLDMYSYYRSLCLPIGEAAAAVGLSATLMEEIFEGDKVSLSVLIDLAKAEVFAKAQLKVSHLRNLEQNKGKDTKLQLAFLEKVFDYGDKSKLQLMSGVDEEGKDKKWVVEIVNVETQPKGEEGAE